MLFARIVIDNRESYTKLRGFEKYNAGYRSNKRVLGRDQDRKNALTLITLSCLNLSLSHMSHGQSYIKTASQNY